MRTRLFGRGLSCSLSETERSGEKESGRSEGNSENREEAAKTVESARLRFFGATTASDEVLRAGWLCCLVAEVVVSCATWSAAIVVLVVCVLGVAALPSAHGSAGSFVRALSVCGAAALPSAFDWEVFLIDEACFVAEVLVRCWLLRAETL